MTPVARALVSISVLIVSGKMFGEAALKFGLPESVGCVVAGIVFSPYLLGSDIVIHGEPLVVFNEYVAFVAELALLFVIFAAGLELSLDELRKVGLAGVLIGVGEALFVFFTSFVIIAGALQLSATDALVLATALVPTSTAMIAATRSIRGINRSLLLSIAIIDDIMSLNILAASLMAIQLGRTYIDAQQLFSGLMISLGLFFAIVLIGTYVVRPIARTLRATLEPEHARVHMRAIAIALCFAFVGLMAGMGYEMILGAFAAGIIVASTEMYEEARRFASQLSSVFAPIFFTYVGAALNPQRLSPWILPTACVVILIAVATKLFIVSLLSYPLTRSLLRSIQLGAVLTPRAEVGIVVAGLAFSMAAITPEIYAVIIVESIATCFAAPLILAATYRVKPSLTKQPAEPDQAE